MADGFAEVVAGKPGLPARRSTGNHVDVLLVDEPCQLERVVGLFLSGEDERLAVVVSRADVLESGVERNGRHAQDAPGVGHHGIGEDIGGMAVEVVADTFVAQHHTLRTAR